MPCKVNISDIFSPLRQSATTEKPRSCRVVCATASFPFVPPHRTLWKRKRITPSPGTAIQCILRSPSRLTMLGGGKNEFESSITQVQEARSGGRPHCGKSSASCSTFLVPVNLVPDIDDPLTGQAFAGPSSDRSSAMPTDDVTNTRDRRTGNLKEMRIEDK